MYNWYDNRTLEAVKPRFVSAVDNGNLVCALWTVKQGCLGAIREPIFRPETLQGLRDHLDTIEEIFKSENQEESLLAGVREMKQKVGIADRFTGDLAGRPGRLRARDRRAGEEAFIGSDRDRGAMVGIRIAPAHLSPREPRV